MREPAPGHELDDVVPIARPHGPVDGVTEIATGLEPGHRALLQTAHGPAHVPLHQVAEDLCEQLVVAVALLGGIERYDERVLPREVGQHVAAPGHAGDRIGQRSRHLLQEASLDQQPALRFGLAVEDFVGQVLADAARIQRQFGHEVGGIPGARHSHGGQPHAGHPSLGPRHEQVEVLLRQGDAMDREQFGDLGRGHRQVARAQLVHLPRQPVPVQRQHEIVAGGQDQAQPRLPAAYQAVQALQDVGMGEHVRVIHDHDDRSRIRHPAEQGLDQINPRSPRSRDRRAALIAVGFPQRGLEQVPEPPGLRVRRRRGEPGGPGGGTGAA